jgi:hypothetical protein
MTTVLFKRSLLTKTGLYRTDVPLADRLWAYRSALHSDTMVVPETLATWRQHSEQDTAVGRNMTELDRHRYRRRIWQAIAETVKECEPLFPETWRNEPDFVNRILWAERRHYYDHYSLTRTSLRHRPYRFFQGVFCAALLEPQHLVGRLGRGLAWEKDCDLSEAQYLDRLRGELGLN